MRAALYARVSEVIALRECDIGDGYLLLPNLKQKDKGARKQVVLNPNSDLCLKLILYCRQNAISGLARVFPFSKEWAEAIFREAQKELESINLRGERARWSWPQPGLILSGTLTPTGWLGLVCLALSSVITWVIVHFR